MPRNKKKNKKIKKRWKIDLLFYNELENILDERFTQILFH